MNELEVCLKCGANEFSFFKEYLLCNNCLTPKTIVIDNLQIINTLKELCNTCSLSYPDAIKFYDLLLTKLPITEQAKKFAQSVFDVHLMEQELNYVQAMGGDCA